LWIPWKTYENGSLLCGLLCGRRWLQGCCSRDKKKIMKRLVGVGVKSVLIQRSVPQQSVCCLRCCSIFHSGVSIFHPWRHRLLNGPICHPRVLGTEYITPGPGGVVAYIRIQALLPAGLLGNQFLECLMQTSKFSYGSNL